MHDASDYWVTQLRELVGADDSYDLYLSPLHRIVTGLSNADLETQIILDPTIVDARDWMDCTPLMWAALRDNPTALRTLLDQKANVNLIDTEGRSALHYAARLGSLDCISALLDAQASWNIADCNGSTPLHDLAYLDIPSNQIEDCIVLLQNYGADLEARNHNGWTPLYKAVDLGHHTAVDAFMKCGADINAADWSDIPPIGRAIFRDKPDVLRRLCTSRTQSSWSPRWHDIDSILVEAAIHGSIQTMDILRDSDLPIVECHIETLFFYFEDHRRELDHSGQSLVNGENLAAFKRLVATKAKACDCEESDPQSDEHTDTPNDASALDQDLDGNFYDAVEHHSFPIECPSYVSAIEV